jgi:Fur family ferric uptake transcriptional regulator
MRNRHDQQLSSAASELPAQMIRAAGAKVTRGRVRVLEALRAASKPLSHAELESQLAGHGASDGTSDGATGVDRVTLYRILDLLVASGLALKAVDTRGVFRYSGAGSGRRHAGHLHFHCVRCGGMFCLEAEPPLPPALPPGFTLQDVAFELRGTCPQCAISTTA